MRILLTAKDVGSARQNLSFAEKCIEEQSQTHPGISFRTLQTFITSW